MRAQVTMDPTPQMPTPCLCDPGHVAAPLCLRFLTWKMESPHTCPSVQGAPLWLWGLGVSCPVLCVLVSRSVVSNSL